jgi:hypothetical protein
MIAATMKFIFALLGFDFNCVNPTIINKIGVNQYIIINNISIMNPSIFASLSGL